jgi:hypothetical protein
MWIVDYGTDTIFSEAALYEAPFAYVEAHVKPTRVGKREKRTNENWWIFQWARPLMRKAVRRLPRFIVTPEVSKHRVFAWMRHPTVPDKNLIVIARSDDTTFGILHSRFHELWALRTCTWMGKGNDPRYTSTTTFETFPFPEGLTPNLDPAYYMNPHAGAIAEAALTLNALRENWLNPPDLVKRAPEVVEGYPDRLLPVDAAAEKELKRRTLTNLYNARPTWLDNAHKALDAAVAAAYGWNDYAADMPEEEILARLLALNLERAGVRNG